MPIRETAIYSPQDTSLAPTSPVLVSGVCGWSEIGWSGESQFPTPASLNPPEPSEVPLGLMHEDTR